MISPGSVTVQQESWERSNHELNFELEFIVSFNFLLVRYFLFELYLLIYIASVVALASL